MEKMDPAVFGDASEQIGSPQVDPNCEFDAPQYTDFHSLDMDDPEADKWFGILPKEGQYENPATITKRKRRATPRRRTK